MKILYGEEMKSEDFGEKIIKLREYHNLSQEDLAKRMNVTRQTISYWEQNRGKPSKKNIYSLCKIFGVRYEYFFDDAAIISEKMTSESVSFEEEAVAEDDAAKVASEEAAKIEAETAETLKAEAEKAAALRAMVLRKKKCAKWLLVLCVFFVVFLVATICVGNIVLTINTGDYYVSTIPLKRAHFYIILSCAIAFSLFTLGQGVHYVMIKRKYKKMQEQYNEMSEKTR